MKIRSLFPYLLKKSSGLPLTLMAKNVTQTILSESQRAGRCGRVVKKEVTESSLTVTDLKSCFGSIGLNVGQVLTHFHLYAWKI